MCCAQVFDAFIQSTTTYQQLLLRIKQQYDAALYDAMGSAYDNIYIRGELALAQQRMVRQSAAGCPVLMTEVGVSEHKAASVTMLPAAFRW